MLSTASLPTRLANGSKGNYAQPLKVGFSARHKVGARNEDSNIVKSNIQVEPITGVTVPEFIWSNLHKWSNAPAIECGVTGRKYTYEQLYKLSRNFGAALVQHGLKRQDVAAVLLHNIPEYPLVILGILEAGMIGTTLNPTSTLEEVAQQVNNSEAKVMITFPELVPLVREVQQLSPSLKSIIVIGEPVEGCQSLSEMVKVNCDGTEFVNGSQIDTAEEIALLPYSSGTTGPPKGVMLTHSNICSNLYQMTRPGYNNINFFEQGTSQERVLVVLPYFHIFALAEIMFGSLYQGAFTRTLPKFDPLTFIRGFREHKPTYIHLVPTLITFMANSPEFTKKEFESLHSIMGGGAPIGKALINRLLQKAEKYFFFQEGYGMTELSPVSHVLPESTKNGKIGSCGVVVPGTECKVIDPSTGTILRRQQRGEICVRGPQVMKGYFKNEKATAKAIDSEGWLHTGDIGFYDDEGCFYVIGRKIDFIKVNGHPDVAPSELEDIIRSHPEVAEVGVIGVPDERSGEVPRAYIIRKGDKLSEQDIKTFVSERVSDHMQLHGGVEFLSIIPTSGSGKILRRKLRDSYCVKM